MRQDHLRQALNRNQDGNKDSPQDVLDRLTVSQAAERLGVTQDAVRKRISRGTIRHDKDHDGRIFVYLDSFEIESETVQDRDQDQESETVQDGGQDKYTRSLEDQINFLRQELERKDTIIMSLTQRIPELESAPELRDAPQTDSESTKNGTPGPEDQERPQERRSWWRRFFGIE
jgi:excisionase family DNA binding protein